MIGKSGLLQLLKEAIRQDFLDRRFLMELSENIKTKLK